MLTGRVVEPRSVSARIAFLSKRLIVKTLVVGLTTKTKSAFQTGEFVRLMGVVFCERAEFESRINSTNGSGLVSQEETMLAETTRI